MAGVISNTFGVPSNNMNIGGYGASRGVSLARPTMWGNPSQPQPQSPTQSSYGLYNTAVEQQAKDYDSIMGKYNDYFTKLQNPNTWNYQQSQDSKDSLATLKNFSQNGGYSDQDIYALRERGISPIRSVYASANRDVDRQRALQGGRSANYNAVKAKMAREMSNQIADQMNDVNAGIAERQAANKLSAAGSYAGAAGAENELRNKYIDQNYQLQGDALRGMTSLYGTTPALAQLFGSQALQQSSLQNDINQGNANNNLRLISSMISGLN